MKIFFDTEFQELSAENKLGDTVLSLVPISFGFVKEDGAELYVPIGGLRRMLFTDWVLKNVGKHLQFIDNQGGRPITVGDHETMAVKKITSFCGDSPEFWADYGAYDWVVLCQLFGSMMDLPKAWPMYVRDFQQHLDDQVIWTGDPEDLLQCVPRRLLETEGPKQDPATLHHALHDARHLKAQYDFIQSRL